MPPQPQSFPIEKPDNPTIPCSAPGCAEYIVLKSVDITPGSELFDCWHDSIPALENEGWGVYKKRSDNGDVTHFGYCPKHLSLIGELEKTGRLLLPLPPFTRWTKCGKCGSENVIWEYCDGALKYVNVESGGQEHLGCKCNKCGFAWAMGCRAGNPLMKLFWRMIHGCLSRKKRNYVADRSDVRSTDGILGQEYSAGSGEREI